ncbi:hypothetical protein A374_01289 [Fictibacillus macauensis ZFHKF-1]|uniref:Uncharacterized protein n=1 Tax=Fictibacillus macauensis ZFHKF-1 TaxID=1196324 RepID=I8UK78_9BACL|nr:hypothetical protein [Fictibacillus macauensis]EIT87233.1 hypothetical protein A374_01289 [Fictibacillus macauensis ZFHKF-1]
MSYSERIIQKMKEMYIVDYQAKLHIDKAQHSIHVFFSDMKFKLRIVEKKTSDVMIRIQDSVPGMFVEVIILDHKLGFERTPEGLITVWIEIGDKSSELDLLQWDGNIVQSYRFKKEFTIPMLNVYLREAFDDILF